MKNYFRMEWRSFWYQISSMLPNLYSFLGAAVGIAHLSATILVCILVAVCGGCSVEWRRRMSAEAAESRRCRLSNHCRGRTHVASWLGHGRLVLCHQYLRVKLNLVLWSVDSCTSVGCTTIVKFHLTLTFSSLGLFYAIF